MADTGVSHYPEAKSVIWVYDVDADRRLRNGRVFASMEMDGKVGVADGIRCDEDGNVAGMGCPRGAASDNAHSVSRGGGNARQNRVHASYRLRIVLNGLMGELLMPPMNTLDDRQLAAILTYIRRAWGHEAGPVSAETVARVRAATAGREEPWTRNELSALVVPE